MRQRIVLMILKFLASAFALTLLLAQIPAAALPGMGAASLAPRAPRTEDPREIVADGFEEIIGRELTAGETRQLNQAIKQLESVDEPRMQRVALFDQAYDLWESYEKLPIICIYGKFSGKIPFSTKKFSLNGAAIGYEITPCLVLNSFNPWAWRLREFRSYVMQGGSLAQNGGQFGGVAGGIFIGLYAGPRALAHPLIGTYGFMRLTLDRAIVKGSAQVAYSNNKQMLAMIGVGGELSFDAIFRAFRLMPKADANSVSVAGVKAEVGMYFDVKEFPWFHRIVVQGMGPIDAFSDVNSYVASTN